MPRLKVLFVVSECVPFAKAGGLGDVSGALPITLAARGHDVRVVLPRYRTAASHPATKLPAPLDGSFVLMIDPMLATGGSAVAALDLLKAAGASSVGIVCIVAAPEGVALVERHYPSVSIFTPVIDGGLNELKYIVPGLGDFGDRLYGTK